MSEGDKKHLFHLNYFIIYFFNSLVKECDKCGVKNPFYITEVQGDLLNIFVDIRDNA